MSALGIGPEVASGYPLEVVGGEVSRDAVVRDIRSAPSLRAARLEEAERRRARLNHPAYRTRVAAERATAVPDPSPAQDSSAIVISVAVGKIAAYLLAFALVIGAGAWLGTQFQPTAYSGDTWSHSVQAGETLSGLASTVATDRSVEAVMEDIRVMNGLQSDLLVPGQIVTLPSQ